MKIKTKGMDQPQANSVKYLFLITAIYCFFIALPAYGQVDFPVREYTNPNEIVTFDRTTSFNRALDVINRFARKYAGKMIIDRTNYEGNIGISVPPMHWRDALELILHKQYMQLIEKREYFEIIPYSPATGPTVSGPAGFGTPDTMLTTHSKEIRIHAIFFEGNRRALQEIGVDWSTLTNNVPENVGSFFGQQQGGGGGGGAGGGRGGNLPVNDGTFDGPFVSVNAKGAQSVSQNVFNAIINFGEIFGSGIRVQALFSAFEADNLGTVLASPSIRVLEGQTGHIQVGQDFSIKQRDFAGNVIEEFFSVGTILTVVPQVISYKDTSFIHLTIEAERSTVNPDPVSTIINKQNATTEALLLDSETTVIAGLYQTQKTEVRKGIPILKDLPAWFFGLRYVFGYTSHTYQTRELVILIKAEIVPSIVQRIDQKLDGKFQVLQDRRIEMRKDVMKYRETIETPDVLPTDDPQNIFEEDHELDIPDETSVDMDKPVEVNTSVEEDTLEIRNNSESDDEELVSQNEIPDNKNNEETKLKYTGIDKIDIPKSITRNAKSYDYYIIGGSFKNKENAYDYRRKLKNSGYEPEILINVEDGFYMVAYKGFDNYSKALLFYSDIRDEANSDAWIFDNF